MMKKIIVMRFIVKHISKFVYVAGYVVGRAKPLIKQLKKKN